MAEDKTEELAKKIDGKSGAGGGGKTLMIVALVVVALCSSGGFLVGSMLRQASKLTAQDAKAAEAEAESPVSGEAEYFSFEPFTVTLDTPRRDRFLVVTVALKFDKNHKKQVIELMEKRKREIRCRLTLYLNSRTLEDVSGTKNLKKILRELQDQINEYLWPNSKPMVEEVLFESMAIQ